MGKPHCFNLDQAPLAGTFKVPLDWWPSCTSNRTWVWTLMTQVKKLICLRIQPVYIPLWRWDILLFKNNSMCMWCVPVYVSVCTCSRVWHMCGSQRMTVGVTLTSTWLETGALLLSTACARESHTLPPISCSASHLTVITGFLPFVSSSVAWASKLR